MSEHYPKSPQSEHEQPKKEWQLEDLATKDSFWISGEESSQIQRLIARDPESVRVFLYEMAEDSSNDRNQRVAAARLHDLLWYEHEVNDDEHIPITTAHLVALMHGEYSDDMFVEKAADIAWLAASIITRWPDVRPAIGEWLQAECEATGAPEPDRSEYDRWGNYLGRPGDPVGDDEHRY